MTLLAKRDKIELGVDFQKPTSFGTWYAVQFQAVTAIVLADSRLDSNAASGLLNNFKEEFELNYFEACQEPTSVSVDELDIYKILLRLVNEYGSEYNKIEIPSIENKESIDIVDSNEEKMEKVQHSIQFVEEKVTNKPVAAARPVRTAAQLYAQKRNDRLVRENALKKKRILIGAIIAILVFLAIVVLIII